VIFLLDVGKASAFFVSFLCAWNTKLRLHFGMRVLFSPQANCDRIFLYFKKIQNKYLMGETERLASQVFAQLGRHVHPLFICNTFILFFIYILYK